MTKRRALRGKKLLVAAGIAGASMIGCEGETVANLVAPPDSGSQMDAEVSEDAAVFPLDAPVANLLPPPDSGMDGGEEATDAGDATDAGEVIDDAAMPDDAAVIGFPDAPIANLLPPPDASFSSEES